MSDKTEDLKKTAQDSNSKDPQLSKGNGPGEGSSKGKPSKPMFKKSSAGPESTNKSKREEKMIKNSEKGSEAAATSQDLVVNKSKEEADEMEVLGPENNLSQADQNTKVSKWAFWKRPSKRDQQLSQISDGYHEMLSLVRSIRGQMESQNENNIILRDSLAHLPDAMKGLDNFSKSQETVGKVLEEIHGQMKEVAAKDDKLADSMTGFNSTLKGMDGTTKATMETFDRVQEQMRGSEENMGKTMLKIQRSMAMMQSIFLVCLLLAVGALVYGFIVKKDEIMKLINPPAKVEEAQAVEQVAEQVSGAEAVPVAVPAVSE